MAALDAGAEIAHWPRCRGHDVHVDAKAFAIHAARVADAAAAVDTIGRRNGMDELTAFLRLTADSFDLVAPTACPPKIFVGHLVAVDVDLNRNNS